jgi:hypothetical protein
MPDHHVIGGGRPAMLVPRVREGFGGSMRRMPAHAVLWTSASLGSGTGTMRHPRARG